MVGRDTRLEEAMRAAPIGMCLVAPDGSFIDVNDALCAILGRDEATLRASTWQELTHPPDVAGDEVLVGDILEGRRDGYRIIKRYLRPDGAVVYGDLSVSCVRDSSGAVDYFISQIVDTTAEVEMRDRYRLLAENASDVVALGDNDGVLRWLSPSVTAMLGHDAETLVGVPFLDLVHPDDLAAVRRVQRRLLDGGSAQLELRLRHADGSFRWVNVRLRPVIGEDGSVVGRVAAWWDAEQAHRDAEALRISQERYRAALEAQSDVHLLLDAVRDEDGAVVDFTFSDSNSAAARWMGRTTDDLRGRRLFEEFALQRDQLLPMYARVVDSGDALSLDGVPIFSAVLGREAYFDLRAVKVGDGISLAFRNVSERVESQRALRESERQAQELAERYEDARNDALHANAAKTMFLSRMSHELRTPLNSVLGFAQLLSMEALTEDQLDAVTQIRTAGKHLLDLVSEILDISRIESGNLSLSMESVSVFDAVGETFDLVRTLAADAGVEIDRGADGCRAYVWADRQRVIQILLNLVNNAVKYNRPGGRVDVWCELVDDRAVAIRVADTGVGMRPDQLARVFQPFDRLGAESTDVEGTGIGLALSQSLARIMSGRIEVASILGEGSVFTLILPLATQSAAAADELVAREPPATAGRRIDVLYIEDNPANRTLMERILRLRPDATLRTAADARAGLAQAAAATPDLLLLDLHLPDMSGDAVLARLRQLPGLADVPIVIVTADASQGLARRLSEAGATAVITKPIEVGEVLAWADDPLGMARRALEGGR